MYPDLSYFFHDLFGTTPDNWTSIFKTFGLFLVLAILSAAYILFIELKRKEKVGLLKPGTMTVVEGKPASIGEILSNALFGFILGFKLLYIFQNFSEFQADAGGVVLSAKGNWLGGVIGAILVAGWKYWDGQKRKKDPPLEKTVPVWPHERIGDITLLGCLLRYCWRQGV